MFVQCKFLPTNFKILKMTIIRFKNLVNEKEKLFSILYSYWKVLSSLGKNDSLATLLVVATFQSIRKKTLKTNIVLSWLDWWHTQFFLVKFSSLPLKVELKLTGVEKCTW